MLALATIIVPEIGSYLLLISLFSLIVVAFAKRGSLRRWHDADEWMDEFDYEQYPEFVDYLKDERVWMDRLYGNLANHKDAPNRYTPESEFFPYINGHNHNASFELEPDTDTPVGGVLLVHGLTDSPYYMRAMGDVFRNNGYYVVGIRLPGHGTAPGALVQIHRDEWYDAVRYGAWIVQKKIHQYPNAKFVVGGFSTGGTLLLKYVIQAVMEQNTRIPDRLYLVAPAIAVSPFAIASNWNKAVTWTGAFEKLRWMKVLPEEDPFKYCSFPKNAVDQIHLLSKEVRGLAKDLSKDESLLGTMPVIMSFQSPVDSTVRADALIDLYKKVGNADSQLFWMDVNHSQQSRFEKDRAETRPAAKDIFPDFQSQFILVTNKTDTGKIIPAIHSFIGLQDEDKGELRFQKLRDSDPMAWPERCVALSHICMTIAPSDRFYGQYSHLGRIDPAGDVWGAEKNLLSDLDNDSPNFRRMRYNPFFNLMRQQIEKDLNHIS